MMKTLTLKPFEEKDYFLFTFDLPIVVKYLNIERYETLGLKCAEDDDTVLEIWAFDKYSLERLQNYKPGQKYFTTWECVYNHLDSLIDAKELNALIKENTPDGIFDWYKSEHKKYKTVSLRLDDYYNHFSKFFPFDIVSDYFSIPDKIFYASAFNFTSDNKIAEAWVFKGDPVCISDPEYLDENGNMPWTCLYNHLDSLVNQNDFSEYIRKESEAYGDNVFN